MVIFFLSTQSKKREAIAFLDELKSILENVDFDYDTEDVVERLKELTVAEYSEAKIYKDDLTPPLLFVFGKDINSKFVYVKLKIKGDYQRHVLCVSFHYEKEKMLHVYPTAGMDYSILSDRMIMTNIEFR